MKFFEMTAKEAAERLGTDTENGLTEREAARRLSQYGRNTLPDGKKRSAVRRFFEQLGDFMIIILLAAAAVSFFTSLLSGEPDLTEPVIILAIVTLNALLGTIQELRAEHSLEALKRLSAPHAIAVRGGRELSISSDELVPGDIIRLRAGDMVSADCRLISAVELTADESPLTGESEPVIKEADITLDRLTATGDLKNMLLSSAYITHGSAAAVVCATGKNTEVGKIASMLINTEQAQTPLEKRLAATGRALGTAALVICGVIFFIGTLKHIPPFEMFMTSVSLAVAAIPEGLPAIVTIMLALGLLKLSSHNAIVRNLPSVETLGCATVICTDKTGTLTQNRMTVTDAAAENEALLFELAALCSEEGSAKNPTDRAIEAAAKERGIDVPALKKANGTTQLVPFDSSRKRMSAKCGGRVIVKGALEFVLPLCSKYRASSKEAAITSAHRSRILHDNERMTKNALRVIAVAYKNDGTGGKLTESDLVFAGLIGIADPPRPEAAAAVNTCRAAGIRTIMVTGDHARTAQAIAKKVGIASDTAYTGAELDRMDDEALTKALRCCSVFARVSPSHKSRIVNALKADGEIVAMTGDGINDAPALSAADIGCSMGMSGTDVAKSASDMILADDNFATIVRAVREGRAIFDNIKKSVKFLLSSNIGEILTVLFGIIFGLSSPLTAIELLWVNLVTDSFPAIALGLDPPARDIMARKPLDAKKGIFSGGLWLSIMFEGMMIGALALVAYGAGLVLTKSEAAARTMAFFVLSISELTHAFNMRSDSSVLRDGLLKNKYLVLSFIFGAAAQLWIIYFPPAAALFDVCPLDGICLGVCFALSVLPLFIVELQKYAVKRHSI